MRSWSPPDIPALPGRGLPLRVFDTATGELRPVTAQGRASMYVCGITPYDATHLGHAATYVTFDVLQRVLRDGGVEVDYVQNVTDIDEPLLARAAATGQDWVEIAARETELFRTDMEALRVIPPRWYVGAVEAIPEIVETVAGLVAAGAAYELDGDVYFSVASAPHFGGVANLDAETMLRLSAERGGDPGRRGKKDPLDSLLWHRRRPGEPGWDSPFGPGRPGWHVECAAIALRRLGPTIDVQGGGTDLAFPHHELGTAEAVTASGVDPFARAYVHQAMVGLAGEKMSKSRGNLVFVSELLRSGVDPAAIRLALLDHHYRTEWDWLPADLDRAVDRLGRWRRATAAPAGPPADPVLAGVRAALADDLGTPQALGEVDRWAAAAGAGGDTAGSGAAQAPGLVRDLVDALLGVRLAAR